MSDRTDELREDLADLFGPWFWISAGVLAVGIVALAFLWASRHPGQSIFSRFPGPGQGPLTPAETNGHVPVPAAEAGDEVVAGPEEGS